MYVAENNERAICEASARKLKAAPAARSGRKAQAALTDPNHHRLEYTMKLKVTLAAALLAAFLLPAAHAEETDIPMVRIPDKSYEIGKTEVTQGQWKAVMGENPSDFSSCGDNCPVDNVSWNDVHEFISKLNQKTGKQYRLPSGAEWKYACLAGNNTTYCGGNDLDKLAWFKDNSGRTSEVATKKPNAWGLYDMSGNVWEWVEDKYDNEHDWRVLRGGSWLNVARFGRAAIRVRGVPGWRFFSIGFRLARTLP